MRPSGNDFTASKANTDEEGKVGGTTPVGKYSPAGNSFYGLTDMAGNVWEWCSDWYDETLYQTRQGIVVRDPVGPISGSYHVLRGGSCIFNHLSARCANRNSTISGLRIAPSGFRLVMHPNFT